MKTIRLILAAVTMTAAMAGCGKKGGGSDDLSSKTFTVTFAGNGGSEVDPQTVAGHGRVAEPGAPTKTDFIFAGWFTDNNTFADAWNFDTRTVTANMTLYAKWFYPDGINGVGWAECNVDAAGTFALRADTSGMLYQWNRMTAWSAAGDADPEEWNTTTPGGDLWAAANDPCPTGWRLPTGTEQATLLDAANVTSEWVTLNGAEGRKFTDKVSGVSIFLPAVGYLTANKGLLTDQGAIGSYWSTSPSATTSAWYLTINNGENAYLPPAYLPPAYQGGYNRGAGLSVRCVRQ